MSGMLYLVPTPIGNLGDISQRCRATLESADFIAAEDTRVTLKLLNHLGIKKPLISYHEHNQREQGERLCERMLAGETLVQVSDAGMPAISDPGADLVALCAEKGIPVTVVPGPSAFVAALAVSGLPTGRFTFEGFLSVNKRVRREHLAELAAERRTMLFYEAPHKLRATLHDMLAAWGDRRITLARELTKLHEEIVRTTLSAACAMYEETDPRGEFVLVVEGAPETAAEDEEMTLEQAVQTAREYMDGGASAADAAKRAAALSGFKKGDIYKALFA